MDAVVLWSVLVFVITIPGCKAQVLSWTDHLQLIALAGHWCTDAQECKSRQLLEKADR